MELDFQRIGRIGAIAVLVLILLGFLANFVLDPTYVEQNGEIVMELQPIWG